MRVVGLADLFSFGIDDRVHVHAGAVYDRVDVRVVVLHEDVIFAEGEW